MATDIVRFLKPWRGYAAEEKAGFEADTAAVLVDKGLAEYSGKSAGKKESQQSENQQRARRGQHRNGDHCRPRQPGR